MPASQGLGAHARRRLKKLSMQLLGRLPRFVRDPLILKRLHPETDTLSEVVVKVAETPDEHEQASRLLFDAYVESDLVPRHGVPVRVTPFLLLPSTLRFVAIVKGQVVATLSLVQDSELGLPLEAAYGEAVQALRARRALIAEIGALAIHPGHRGAGLTMLLYKAMWKTAAEVLDVKHLVASVRPEAEMFYQAVLCFVRLTHESRRYPGINSDSVCLHLPLATAEARFEQAFGAKPASLGFNPFRFFVHTQHPQLHLPTTNDALEPLRRSHRQAALRLAWLRPEVVLGLEPDAFRAVEDALSGEPHAPAASPPPATRHPDSLH